MSKVEGRGPNDIPIRPWGEGGGGGGGARKAPTLISRTSLIIKIKTYQMWPLLLKFIAEHDYAKILQPHF